MDSDATLASVAAQFPPKRVLPSRVRRGGPGVGSCDIDLMILHAQSNKTENEPLIPADTRFVLKTNDSLEKIAVEFASAGASGINLRAQESYFDRPEVLKAYREQLIIETPEFYQESDSFTLEKRLRTRQADDNNADSDAVYEKRHRKFEAFEKRQRLREKEKLKHEQYKLKERIEQLRGMDNSAFMAAPASSFSPRPDVPEPLDEDVPAHLVGNVAYLEGERRRREMLRNAEILEERYRILLPPDRVRKPAGQNSMNPSNDPESDFSGNQGHGEGESEIDEPRQRDTQKLKLKLPARPSVPTPASTPKAGPSSSKKRRRSPSNASHPHLPAKTPSVRKLKVGSEQTLGPEGETFNHDGEFQILQYDPEATKPHRPKRPRKRAKTEERELPPQPPGPPPEPVVDVVSDELGPSPHDAASEHFSFPPPPPPPNHYHPHPPTDQAGPRSPEPGSSRTSPAPSGSYNPSLPQSSPTDEGPASAPGTFPEPIAPEREPSVPLIESLSAPAPMGTHAPRGGRGRGRSRGAALRGATPRGAAPTNAAPRKTQRQKEPCHLETAASRTAKNQRASKRTVRDPFGVKLPPIIVNMNGDSYDYELPPEVFVGPDYDDRSQEGDNSREMEGSEITESEDDDDAQDELKDDSSSDDGDVDIT